MELDRRDFLKLSYGLAYSFFISRLATERELGEIDFNKARRLALFFDRKLGELDYTPLEVSQKTLDDVVDKYYQLYSEQGFFDAPIQRPQVGFQDIRTAFGSCDCNGSIYISPYEPTILSRAPEMDEINPRRIVGLVTHELVHNYQESLCFEEVTQSSWGIEETSQVVRFEILASLARDGDLDARQAIIFELREMSLGTALFMAYQTGRMQEFTELLSNMGSGEFSTYDLDYWQERVQILEDKRELVYTLYRNYEIVPLTLLMNVSSLKPEIHGLDLPSKDGESRVGTFDDFVVILDELMEN